MVSDFLIGVLTRAVNVPVKLTLSLWAPVLSFQSLAVLSVAQLLTRFLKPLSQLLLRKAGALLLLSDIEQIKANGVGR